MTHASFPALWQIEKQQEEAASSSNRQEQNQLLSVTAAAVERKRFATKEGLSGMGRAARVAEGTAILKLGVRERGGSIG